MILTLVVEYSVVTLTLVMCNFCGDFYLDHGKFYNDFDLDHGSVVN